jgi:hypothetical protein
VDGVRLVVFSHTGKLNKGIDMWFISPSVVDTEMNLFLRTQIRNRTPELPTETLGTWLVTIDTDQSQTQSQKTR